MRRIALIGALILTLLAPAAGATGSGLYGRVTRSPITPVCKVGTPCNGPAVGVRLYFWRAGIVVGHVVTTRTGTYRIALAPGRYAVRLATEPDIGRGLQPPTALAPSGGWAHVNFFYDTGIR